MRAWTADELRLVEASRKQGRRRKQLRIFVQGTVMLFAVIGLLAAGYGIRQLVLNLSARGPMVHFAAGAATLGSDTHPTWRGYPRSQVELEEFWLDTFEVTNRQYLACVLARACTPPSAPASEPAIEAAQGDLPVVYVNAYQAHRFCDWIRRRLPTEAEWERAAQGSEGRIWPWGGEGLTATRANLSFELATGGAAAAPGRPPEPPGPQPPEMETLAETGGLTPPPDLALATGTAPHCLVSVDSQVFENGATPEGIMHLLGNAFEWTTTPSECTDPYRCPTPWDGRRARDGALLAWSIMYGAGHV